LTTPAERLSSALGDRYAVERQVGEGGMATVYLARDLKHDRKVAIKVLKPELAASLGADRFLREIRVAATLQHPNILGLYDSGEVDGLLYYVMPFVEGESLRDRLDKEQQLPLHDALQITREAAEALQHAHAHGIIHRDIKPENILLMGGHALVADFGIARAVSEAGGEKLTQTGMAVGTPHYMSPEQSLGSDHVDARSDIYSLGCVLYELLIGQPPFTANNAMAILARHAMEAVPSLQVVRPSVPDEVEDAVLRALEKTPADRFQTMQEFADSLVPSEAEATMTRTATRRTTPGVRRTPTRQLALMAAQQAARKRKLYIGGGAVLALLLAGGAWTMFHDKAPATTALTAGDLDPHRVAVLYFQDRDPSDSLGLLADGLTEGLIRQLDEVQTLDVISANGVAPYRGDSIAPDSIARALKVGTLVRGDIERRGDKIQVSVRLTDGASGTDYDRGSFEQPAANVLGIQDTLVHQVAALIRKQLGQEIEVREQQATTTSTQAWLLVQRAQEERKRAAAALTGDGGAELAARDYAESDSIYGLAHAADPRWAEPLIGQASLAYQRSRMVAQDKLAAKSFIDRGISLADTALALSPNNPDALEARGTLRYWAWLLGLQPDRNAAKQLFTDAQGDLELATRLRPAQAGAWAILSHLYTQEGFGESQALNAAQRAYDADAYLSNADQVLTRLFLASFDLGQFVDAAHWCDEGGRRFPDNFAFVSCHLWMLTTRWAKDPDAALAWKLADSVVALAPAPRRDFETLKAHMAVAAVLARAGLADSARNLARRSRGAADVDPTRDLAYLDAFVQTLLKDPKEAVKSLTAYLAVNPNQRAGLASDPGWFFRSLQDDPGFEQLVKSN
jgi:serine/threonine-protein kinase